MEILESGVMCEDEDRVWLHDFVSSVDPSSTIMIAKDQDWITHWWKLIGDDGRPITYLGTKESFEQWQKERVN